MIAGPGRDVRDVLLPQPVHPAGHGLQPAAGRRSRSCRSRFGIVIGAGISSNLVNRIDPRYLAGIGTLLAAVALFGFSRLSVPNSAATCSRSDDGSLGADVNYWTSIFPFIVLMAIGMGLTFVPLDPHRGAPRARRGLRHRLRRAQHDAAGRWRPRPRHPQHRRAALRGPTRTTRSTGSLTAQGVAARAGRDLGRRGSGLHRGRHRRLPGRRGHDARRLARRSGCSSTSSTRSSPPTARRPRPRRLRPDAATARTAESTPFRTLAGRRRSASQDRFGRARAAAARAPSAASRRGAGQPAGRGQHQPVARPRPGRGRACRASAAPAR